MSTDDRRNASLPIVVNGESSKWFHFFRLVCFLGIMLGIGLLAIDSVVSIMVLIFAVPLTIGMEISAWNTRCKRWSIELLPAGFSVIDARGRHEYRDEDIQSIAFSTKNHFVNGNLKGYRRKCSLWLANQPQPLEMNNLYQTNQEDPVQGFIRRIIDLLVEGLNHALIHGLAIEGEGWKLTSADLSFQTPKKTWLTVPLHEISSLGDFDEKMCVWRRGESEPCAAFKVDGRNVWLLPMLLRPLLQEETNAHEPPADGLGKILFLRKNSPVSFWLMVSIGPILLAVGAVLILFSNGKEDGILSGIVAGLIGVVMIFAAVVGYFAKFRAHEWGVFQTGLFGTNQLQYLDMAQFAYGATRHYHNGAYTGTTIVLKFIPLQGKGKTISYATHVQGDDSALEQLRDFIAQAIANRMMQELSAGSTVAWTNNITIRPNAFEIRPAGFFGRKDAVVMPFSNYGGWNMAEGIFYMYEKGKTNAVMNEQVSEPNFFPGFFVLMRLFHSDAPAEA